MNFFKKIGSLFSRKRSFVPIFAQQAAFLCQTSKALRLMLETTDASQWHRWEKEIKLCEVQGTALLTEFHEILSGKFIGPVANIDLQTIAMSMDDFLDVIKDAANVIIMYRPTKIDPQLQDLAEIVTSEAEVLRAMLPLLEHIGKKVSEISLNCDRINELEHSADESYEAYMGYIFENEPDIREMIKYKGLAEVLENATDSGKRVADNVRKLLLKYHEA